MLSPNYRAKAANIDVNYTIPLIFKHILNFSLDREAWRAAVHGVTKSQELRDWTELRELGRGT